MPRNRIDRDDHSISGEKTSPSELQKLLTESHHGFQFRGGRLPGMNGAGTIYRAINGYLNWMGEGHDLGRSPLVSLFRNRYKTPDDHLYPNLVMEEQKRLALPFQKFESPSRGKFAAALRGVKPDQHRWEQMLSISNFYTDIAFDEHHGLGPDKPNFNELLIGSYLLGRGVTIKRETLNIWVLSEIMKRGYRKIDMGDDACADLVRDLRKHHHIGIEIEYLRNLFRETWEKYATDQTGTDEENSIAGKITEGIKIRFGTT